MNPPRNVNKTGRERRFRPRRRVGASAFFGERAVTLAGSGY
jgi:hypothetical protein